MLWGSGAARPPRNSAPAVRLDAVRLQAGSVRGGFGSTPIHSVSVRFGCASQEFHCGSVQFGSQFGSVRIGSVRGDLSGRFGSVRFASRTPFGAVQLGTLRGSVRFGAILWHKIIFTV